MKPKLCRLFIDQEQVQATQKSSCARSHRNFRASFRRRLAQLPSTKEASVTRRQRCAATLPPAVDQPARRRHPSVQRYGDERRARPNHSHLSCLRPHAPCGAGHVDAAPGGGGQGCRGNRHSVSAPHPLAVLPNPQRPPSAKLCTQPGCLPAFRLQAGSDTDMWTARQSTRMKGRWGRRWRRCWPTAP